MAKTPATQLNDFFNKLALWLQNNQPEFVERYNVTATHVPAKIGDDVSKIRMVLNFEILDKKIASLSEAELVEGLEL